MNEHRGQGTYVSLQSLPLVTNRLTGSSRIGPDDVTLLAQVMSEQMAFAVAANSSFRTGADLVRAVRRAPGKVTFAVSSSPGGQSHLAAALFVKAAGVDPRRLKIVFLDSDAQALAVLLTSADIAQGAARSGSLRIVGTPAPAGQAADVADIPTRKPQGLDFEMSTWRVVGGPKGMTAPKIG